MNAATSGDEAAPRVPPIEFPIWIIRIGVVVNFGVSCLDPNNKKDEDDKGVAVRLVAVEMAMEARGIKNGMCNAMGCTAMRGF